MEQISPRLRSWASILDPAHPRAGAHHVPDAVHLPARRADAGRPPGQGGDRRQRHPHARRDHPRRRRRRHRLRDDRRAHPVHRARTCRPTGAPLREAIEAAVPLSAGGYNREVSRDHTASRVADLRAPGRGRGLRPGAVRAATGGCSWARSARATTSSRSASTRRTGCGCSCTRARAASATRSPSTTSRWPSRLCRAVVDRPARPRPGLPRRGHRGVRGVPARRCGGRSTSPCSTARR